MPNLFRADNGLIIALDCNGEKELVRGLESTKDLEGVVAYKPGCVPLLSIEGGISHITNIIREYTDLPIIYDNQKFCLARDDEEELSLPSKISPIMKQSDVDSVIVLGIANNNINSAYKADLEIFIRTFQKNDIIPIVVAHMTTPDYLEREGGLVPNDVPEFSYRLAAKMGIEYFVIPGNKQKDSEHYVEMISELIKEPKFLIPGFGSQGGDKNNIFHITKGCPTYMIIGPYDNIDFSKMDSYAELMSKPEILL